MGTTVFINPFLSTPAFSPASISGLRVWVRADDLALSDGDPVSTWVDQSGNANNFTQAGTVRPTYKTNIQNGRPVVRFDGVDDLMNASSATTIRHVFAVIRINAATFPSGNSGFQGIVSTTLNTDPLMLVGMESSTRFYDDTLTTAYHLNGTSYAEANMQAPMSTWGVCSLSYSTGWASVTPRLGHERANFTRYFNGDIGEVVLYDSVLSSTDRQSVEAYLKARWGTP